MDNLHKFLNLGVLVNDEPNKQEMDLRALFSKDGAMELIKDETKELEKRNED